MKEIARTDKLIVVLCNKNVGELEKIKRGIEELTGSHVFDESTGEYE